MTATPSYEEIVNFIASGTTPESVIAKSPNGEISSSEQAELDDYLYLEHLLILAKARARQNLQLAS